MQVLFAVTLFVSALLLFLVQPLMGKLLLPLLGGTPAVWNTCMVFFQAALLLGYLYAHWSTARLGVRRQAIAHLVLLALPMAMFGILAARGEVPFLAVRDLSPGPPAEGSPLVWLLGALAVSAGLPFFVVATSAPLLQKWFAGTGHPSAADPYFLYAASNLGSMVALLGYPLAVEPTLPLAEQGLLWAIGYAAFVGLAGLCAVALWRSPPAAGPAVIAGPAEPLTPRRRLRWVVLALVPSSLMLGVTNYLSTDLAAVPLLWVVPLALYLLTFILVFSRRERLRHAAMARALPVGVLALTVVMLIGATQPLSVLVVLHLATFFVAAMVCHGELARDRPDPRHLTEFYLWMSVGGVLGGAFNALIAPALFPRAGLVEYPLMLVAACLLRPPPAGPPVRLNRLDVILPLAVAALAAAALVVVSAAGLAPGPLRTGLAFGLPAVLAFLLVDRPVRFALGVAALLLVGATDEGPNGRAVYTERNFFGVVRVTRDPDGQFVRLVHGTTIHGQQSLTRRGADGRREPLTYYHRTGPIGHVFTGLFNPGRTKRRVAAVGLGAGSIAYYAEPGQDWTFFEIDPAVARIASSRADYFDFFRECRAGEPRVVLGDARLRLADEPDGAFGLIVLDAFSSDAIPVHLLTTEALRLYLAKLADGGVIAFHVSNRYLDLRPVLARGAQEVGPLAGLFWFDIDDDEERRAQGKLYSLWVVLARAESDIELLFRTRPWHRIEARPDTPLWTDDFSNLLGAWKRPED